MQTKYSRNITNNNKLTNKLTIIVTYNPRKNWSSVRIILPTMPENNHYNSQKFKLMAVVNI